MTDFVHGTLCGARHGRACDCTPGELAALRAENARLRAALLRAALGHRNLAELGYLTGEVAEVARAYADEYEAVARAALGAGR